MNRLLASTVFIALLPLTLSNTAEPLLGGLSKCAAITRDLQRLACYDLLVSGKQPPADVVLMNQNTANTVTQQRPTPVAPTTTPVSSSTFGLKQQPDASSTKFGLKDTADDSESLHTTIQGQFTGWKKGDKITLANGQVWKIADGGTFHYKATNPSVIIKRGMFGSFRMSVDGLNKTARVVRIK